MQNTDISMGLAARSNRVFLLVVTLGLLFASCQLLLGHDSHVVDSRAVGAIMLRFADDGESLACSFHGAIWRIAPSTGEMVRLTKAGRSFDIEPAWSHDGSKIAYIQSDNFMSGQLALVDARNGESIRLPVEVLTSNRVFFSENNQRLLGVYRTGNSRARLAWYELATGELKDAVAAEHWPAQLTEAINNRRLVFSLAHDLKTLAVVATADVPGEQSGNQGPQCDIWLVSLTGDAPKRIVTWPARIHELCWSADGKSLFAANEFGGVHHDLWEIPLADAERSARKLTFGQADESSPDTSADGRFLCYTDNRNGPTMSVIRNLATNRETIIEPKRYDFGCPSGKVILKVVDSDNREIPARVSVREADGKQFAPPGSLYRLWGGELHFYPESIVTFDLPVGKFTVTATHGPESVPAISTIDIAAGQTTEAVLKVSHWSNQRSENWIAGESHIHANYGFGHWYCTPEFMRQQCEGEDLTVANLMVANSDGNGVFDREFFLGKPDPRSTDRTVLYWNEEYRATIWGHMTLLNLKHLVPPIYSGFKNTTSPYDVPTNADVADHVHDQDGHVNYTHPAQQPADPYLGAYTAKELPMDVALGKVDSMDIMSNQNANMVVWYRLLNCGLRIPASAGTDCFLNRIPSTLPGAVRVYVHCEPQFTYQTWIENLKAGRTFATNGPVMRFSVDEHPAGASLAFASPRAVVVKASVTARAPMDVVEIVINGTPHPLTDRRKSEGEPVNQSTFEQRLDVTQSCWMALRARNSSGMFAHSSPVYITVSERPKISAEDASYFLTWLNRLRDDVRKRNQIPPKHIARVEEQISHAAEFYRRQQSGPPTSR